MQYRNSPFLFPGQPLHCTGRTVHQPCYLHHQKGLPPRKQCSGRTCPTDLHGRESGPLISPTVRKSPSASFCCSCSSADFSSTADSLFNPLCRTLPAASLCCWWYSSVSRLAAAVRNLLSRAVSLLSSPERCLLLHSAAGGPHQFHLLQLYDSSFRPELALYSALFVCRTSPAASFCCRWSSPVCTQPKAVPGLSGHVGGRISTPRLFRLLS